jgi:crotonobetainyl-CoA:carnitine CoA-transferase CaiB-like acyl-CoA transferase
MPLEGVRVLDRDDHRGAVRRDADGHYGADVIKVSIRAATLRLSGAQKNGVPLSYAYYGRNKRSIVIDFGSPDGQARCAISRRRATC